MLSILIPTYNYDVSNLVNSLLLQCEENDVEFEIIIFDDASSKKIIDEKLIGHQNIYINRSKENLGLASARNKLGINAEYKWLLFLDADVLPTKNDFIYRYLKNIQTNCNIIYGGIDYLINYENNKLRYHYGIKKESISVYKRLKNNHQFHCSNFIIKKSLFLKNLFDYDIKYYGHEDTLFCYHIFQKNIKINHIENCVYHLGIDSNKTFIQKTKEGLNTLKYLEHLNKLPRDFTSIQKTSLLLHKYKLNFIFVKITNLFEKTIEKNLLSKKPSLYLFDILKLNYFCNLKSTM